MTDFKVDDRVRSVGYDHRWTTGTVKKVVDRTVYVSPDNEAVLNPNDPKGWGAYGTDDIEKIEPDFRKGDIVKVTVQGAVDYVSEPNGGLDVTLPDGITISVPRKDAELVERGVETFGP